MGKVSRWRNPDPCGQRREPDHERDRDAHRDPDESPGRGSPEFPPREIGRAIQVVFHVASEEYQPPLGILGAPPTATRPLRVGAVGRADEGVEQVFLDRRTGRESPAVAELGWVRSYEGLHGPGVVDRACQADHQRSTQRLRDRGDGARGRGLKGCGGVQRGQHRVPAGGGGRARPVATQIDLDCLGVQPAQCDTGRGTQDHRSSIGRVDGQPVLIGSAGQDQRVSRAQRLVDPGDREAADCLRDLVQPIEDRDDQAVIEQSLGQAARSGGPRRRPLQPRMIPHQTRFQPLAKMLTDGIPGRQRHQHRNRFAWSATGQQLKDKAQEQHRLAGPGLAEHDQSTRRHPAAEYIA